MAWSTVATCRQQDVNVLDDLARCYQAHLNPPAHRLPQAAVDEPTSDFPAYTGRLHYGHRLYTGQSIGSGMVEGAAKDLVRRRLK